MNLRAMGKQGQPIESKSTCQAAKVTRPLMSVAKVCRNGYTCQFTDGEARVLDKEGATICKFQRVGGIHVGRMKLRAPSPFGGQA